MSVFAPNLPWTAAGKPKRPFAATGFARLGATLSALWARLTSARQARNTTRRLQVIEKIHLGDKQFVALLELDGQTILASCAPGAPLQFATAQMLSPAQPQPPQAASQEPKTTHTPAGKRAKASKDRPGRFSEAEAAIESPEATPSAARKETPAPALESKRKAIRHGSLKAALSAEGSERPEQNSAAAPQQEASAPEQAAQEAQPKVSIPRQSSLAGLVQPAVARKPATAATARRKPAVPEPAPPLSKQDVTIAPSSPEQPPAHDPKADATFAALLQIRMMATEVFQELDTVPIPPPPPRRPGLARRLSISACFLACCLFAHGTAHAAILAPAPAGNDIHITGLGGSSAPWAIVVVLTLLSLIPSLLFCVTPFARLLIVFHFLRQALGLQTTPSNQTLIGLSLILTFFLMQPTGEVIYRDAILPVQAGKLTPLDGVARAGQPLRHFMSHYVRAKDAELFLDIAHEPRPKTVEDMSFRVLLPAYILSELKAGFQIGTVLFLPFLIVDMVIASITTSVGMVQLPPVVISTPLKLLLFLMVDGWHLLIGSLMRSFN